MKYVICGIKLVSNLTYTDTDKVLFDGMSPLIKTHFLDDFSFLGIFLLEKRVKGGTTTRMTTTRTTTMTSVSQL